MRIEVVDRGTVAPPELKVYVGLRLMSVLDHALRDIEGITVLLDVRRPAQEAEAAATHRCRIVVRFVGGGQIAVEHTDTGTYASIDGAAESVGRFARWTAGDHAEGEPSGPPAAGGAPLRARPITSLGMDIDVRTRGVERKDSIRNHALRRLMFAVRRFGPRIRSLRVDIDDVNGPKGGVDKRCQVAARMVGGDVRVAALDDDAYRAIDRAASRLRRGVARRVGRCKEWALMPSARGGVQ